MIAGVSNQTFYIGSSSHEEEKTGGGGSGENSSSNNGRAYGLVNIATFLAMAVEDSIKYGSCDEINTDIIGGYLPISNACGQYGMNYQNDDDEDDDDCAEYACRLDYSMRTSANPISLGSSSSSSSWVTMGSSNSGSSSNSGGGENTIPPKPFYCGPRSDYGGHTGRWDYISGMEIKDPAVTNSIDRQDVQG